MEIDKICKEVCVSASYIFFIWVSCVVLYMVSEFKEGVVKACSKAEFGPLMSCFKDTRNVLHLIPSNNKTINFVFDYETVLLRPEVSIRGGRSIEGEGQFANQLFEEIFRRESEQDICVFTDGSKTDGDFFGGFSACFSTGEELQFRSRNFASIFTLEAMAVLEALRVIHSRQENVFSIFSDSMSVLKALMTVARFNKTSNIIMQIRQEICSIRKQSKKVKFH